MDSNSVVPFPFEPFSVSLVGQRHFLPKVLFKFIGISKLIPCDVVNRGYRIMQVSMAKEGNQSVKIEMLGKFVPRKT